MKIVFWSPSAGKCKTTSAMVSIVSQAAIKYSKKCAIVITNHKEKIQSMFFSDSSVENLEDSASSFGTGALLRDAKSGMLSPTSVQNASINLTDRLSVFISDSTTDPKIVKRSWESSYTDIANALDNAYDLVFIDTEAGSSQLNQAVLMSADILVICLNQNRLLCEKVFDGSKYDFSKQKCLFLLNDYDSKIGYTDYTLIRSFKHVNNKNLAVLRHSSDFAAAINKNSVLKWVASIQKAKRSSSAYAYAKDLEKATDKLFTLLNIPI